MGNGELLSLERAGLIQQHTQSSANYPIYVVDRVLMARTYLPQLRVLFGSALISRRLLPSVPTRAEHSREDGAHSSHETIPSDPLNPSYRSSKNNTELRRLLRRMAISARTMKR